MGSPTDDASEMLMNTPERLAGSGTTEDVSAQLPHGAYATLLVGATAVRVVISGVSTATGQVAQTSLRLPAGFPLNWTVVKGVSDYVHVEEDTTTAGYECWVWKSSPGKA